MLSLAPNADSYRARLPRSRKRGLVALALLACAGLPANAQEVPLDAGTVRAAVLAETNAYRASKNLPQLQQNAALEAAATAYAAYLAEHEAMGHTADGSSPAKRASAQGYKWCFISENVWNSFRKPQTTLSQELANQAMEGWKKSPGHNANLLEKRAQEIGIGAAGWKQDGEKDIFRVVQVFAAECTGKRQPGSSLGETLAGVVDALRR
jgi:uncharacterized protein YkwD